MIRGSMSRRTPQKQIKAAHHASKNVDHSLLEAIDWSYKLNNNQVYHITKSIPMQEYIERQNIRWIGHVCRAQNNTLTKRLMFPDVRFTKRGYHHPTVYDNVIKGHIANGKSAESFLNESFRKQKRNSNLFFPSPLYVLVNVSVLSCLHSHFSSHFSLFVGHH